jgi:hypothetical protein
VGRPNLENDRFFLQKVHDGILSVTRDGHVFNLKTGREIGVNPTPKGYRQIGMKDSSGKVWHILVHRLVVLVYKRRMKDGEIVNHKNGRKSRNRVKNLEITTYIGNTQHAHATGLVNNEKIAQSLRGVNMGIRSPVAKFSIAEVEEIRRRYNRGTTQRELARKFGVAKRTIERVIHYLSYTY